MTADIPTLLIPGLNCSARLYEPQIPFLWGHGPVMIGDHTRDDSIEAIAARILAQAPPIFRLVGLSMGGYIGLAMLRQAASRIAKLALLDTNARADTPESTERRKKQIEIARAGGFEKITELAFAGDFHPSRRNDQRLREINRQMGRETGIDAFIRQQTAAITRPDARAGLSAIRCPTLVLVGDGDTVTPPALSREIAAAIFGSRLVVLPGVGHMSTLEAPEAVNAALTDWLKD
ncbi:MAG: alpha/beta fold hydrolase [Pseudorhodoplanes sp.]